MGQYSRSHSSHIVIIDTFFSSAFVRFFSLVRMLSSVVLPGVPRRIAYSVYKPIAIGIHWLTHTPWIYHGLNEICYYTNYISKCGAREWTTTCTRRDKNSSLNRQVKMWFIACAFIKYFAIAWCKFMIYVTIEVFCMFQPPSLSTARCYSRTFCGSRCRELPVYVNRCFV